MDPFAMIKAIILLCSVSLPIEECNEKNAIAVERMPMVFRDASSCLMQAQFFAASVSINQDANLKIICKPTVEAAE